MHSRQRGQLKDPRIQQKQEMTDPQKIASAITGGYVDFIYVVFDLPIWDGGTKSF